MRPACGRVLIVEDDSRTCELLRDVFGHAGYTVNEVATGEEALAQAAAERPGLVILGVDAPGAMAYVVCRLLREKYGELLPIIFISGARVETSDRVAGLLLGADDYIVKPLNPSELLARVQRLMVRSRETQSGAPVEGNRSEDFGLTAREQEILGLLLGGASQAEIATELVISSNTVATHIQRILLKLGVHNRTQAVAKAARGGWFSKSERPGELTAFTGAPRPQGKAGHYPRRPSDSASPAAAGEASR